MSEMWCTRLAANTGRKNDAKTRHLGTIAQLCRAISSQLRHVWTIGKNLLNSNISPHKSLQYGGLRPTNVQGCFKLPDRSQPLVCRISPYCEDMWRTYCCLKSFFPIVDMCLRPSCEDIARQSCAMVPR